MARPDTSVKVFNSEMPGAPVLSGTAGSLLAVFDACLSDGFGLRAVDSITLSGGTATLQIATGHSAIRDAVIEISDVTSPPALNGQHKVTGISTQLITISVPDIADQAVVGQPKVKLAGGGWSKAYSDANRTAYKSLVDGATQAFFRVNDSDPRTASIEGFLQMSDINTGSGKFPAGAPTYLPAIDKSYQSSAVKRQWFLLTNGRVVHIGVNFTEQPFKSYCMYSFGDAVSVIQDDAYRAFVACGGYGPGSAYRAQSLPFYFGDPNSVSRSFARAHSGIGSSVSFGIESYGRSIDSGVISGEGLRPFPNPANNALLVAEISMIETPSGVLRATLPGAYAVPQSIAQSVADATTFENLPALPGRRLIARPISAQTSGAWGLACFDMTGPWRK